MSTQTATPTKYRFCPACGAELESTAQFCALCGNKIQSPVAPAPSTSYSYTTTRPAPTPVSTIKYADFGDRMVAFIIDMIFIGIISRLIVSVIEFAVTGNYQFWKTEGFETIIMLIYFGIGDYNRQTIGKAILKLKVVDEQTLGQISSKQAFFHIIGKVFFLPVDVILAMFINETEDEKKFKVRISQRISKTAVIRV
jgi:uncharacterized RDD family membrane protein YckC